MPKLSKVAGMYLYHSVPRDLQGAMLYPLNVLARLYPGLYEEQLKKYVGREHIPRQQIPGLGCAWGDVLHLCRQYHPWRSSRRS